MDGIEQWPFIDAKTGAGIDVSAWSETTSTWTLGQLRTEGGRMSP